MTPESQMGMGALSQAAAPVTQSPQEQGPNPADQIIQELQTTLVGPVNEVLQKYGSKISEQTRQNMTSALSALLSEVTASVPQQPQQFEGY